MTEREREGGGGGGGKQTDRQSRPSKCGRDTSGLTTARDTVFRQARPTWWTMFY